MTVLELTQKLVEIPSYVAGGNTEETVGNYIYDYLTRNTSLVVNRIPVVGSRFNVFAYSRTCMTKANNPELDLLLIDHIDTVEPKSGWDFDQLAGRVKDGKLFGLGAFDTKGNVASLLLAATKVKDQKIGFLFYADEEYDFLGMRGFIESYQNRLSVNQIISADGSNLSVRVACRGLVEFKMALWGQTGHAANPASGVNAVFAFGRLIEELQNRLSCLTDQRLGAPTLNVAYVRGGLYKGQKDGEVLLGAEGNNIADYLEAVIECRTNTQIDAHKLQVMMQEICKKLTIRFETVSLRHNLAAWQTDTTDIQKLIKVMQGDIDSVCFTNPAISGYVDVAMAANAFKCPAFCIGAKGGNAHAVNEWVDIQSLQKLTSIFKKIINTYKP